MEIIERLKKWLSGPRGAVICIFAVIFAAGLAFAPDYGVPYDYPSEGNILYSNIKTMGETVLGEGSLENAWMMKNVPRIEVSKERDHGKAMYYPFALFRLIVRPGASTTYLAMKIYTFIINFIGLIFLYKTALLIFGRRRYAMTAVILWLASPRLVADGFYNEKDMVFASLVIATIYFSLKIIENPRPKTAVFLAICSGFAANIRILGLFFPFLALILYCVERTKKHEWSRKNTLIPVTTAALAFLVMFAVTPAMWYGVIDYFKYTIGFSANFSRWNGYVYYLGNLYNYSENPLPWHYLPGFFLMTTPVVIIALTAAGVALSFKDRRLIMLAVFAILPPFFAIIGKSNVYNGWRHFFFIYPALIVLAVGAVKYFTEKPKTKRAAVFLLAVQVLGSFVWIAANHPHEYVYFNFLSKHAAEKCDLDYWNVSGVECLNKCLELDNGEFTVSCTDMHSENALEGALSVLSRENQERVTELSRTQMHNADYIMSNPVYYRIAQETAENFVPLDETRFKPFVSVECDGITIMEIYRNEAEN